MWSTDPENTPWYQGETLLEHLESLDLAAVSNVGQTKIPRTVRHPPQKRRSITDFRGFAGKVYGGELNVGDDVVALPSQTRSRIKEIYFYDKKYKHGS